MRGLVALVALLAGCRVTEHFACDTDGQCTYGTTAGVCTPNGCAFADTSCASGFRYDETATDDVAEECTGTGATPGCADWNPLHFDACALPQPLGAFTLSEGTYFYDTDTGELRDGAGSVPAPASIVIPQTNPPGPSIRVISVERFVMDGSAHLQVSGTYPIVIAAWTTAAAYGNITVSSSLSLLGAGANPDDCDAGAGQGMGIGGGGGANQGDGGRGGNSFEPPASGGAGGTKRTAPSLIAGGCRGAASSPAGSFAEPPATADARGVGGSGGGAIQITARERIDAVSINANGGGGFGSPAFASSGGGGGGAGGYIGLEAPIVSIAGGLFANGGGGGGGADNTTAGGFGQAGNGGMSAAAGGTTGSGCGSTGGTGASGSTLDGGTGGNLECQGSARGSTGGGGGGAGFVVIKSPMVMKATNTSVSPPETVIP